MKPLAVQMAIYSAYHSDPWNRASHYIGVPLIVFALLVALSWLRVPMTAAGPTAAYVFVAAVLVYYALLDALLAAAVLAFIVPLLYAAGRIAADLPFGRSAAVAAAAFVGGWVFQLIGHAIEGRRPALMDNFFQVFIAPIFLIAELFFALGLRRELQASVRRQSQAHRAPPD